MTKRTAEDIVTPIDAKHVKLIQSYIFFTGMNSGVLKCLFSFLNKKGINTLRLLNTQTRLAIDKNYPVLFAHSFHFRDANNFIRAKMREMEILKNSYQCSEKMYYDYTNHLEDISMNPADYMQALFPLFMSFIALLSDQEKIDHVHAISSGTIKITLFWKTMVTAYIFLFLWYLALTKTEMSLDTYTQLLATIASEQTF